MFVKTPSSISIISIVLGFFCVLVLKMNAGKGKVNCVVLREESELSKVDFYVGFMDLSTIIETVHILIMQ